MNNEEINIRSEEVNQIISDTPSWVVRWGITIFFLFIAILIALTFIIRYPEIVKAQVIVSNPTPPFKIVAQTNGKIDQLFVRDKTLVNADQDIALLSNSAKYEDILSLDSWLNSEKKSAYSITISQNLKLGSIQEFYNDYYQAFTQQKLFVELDLIPLRIKALRRNKQSLEELGSSIELQLKIAEEELEIVKQRYEKDKELSEAGAMAQIELEGTHRTYLQQQLTIQNLKTSVQNNTLRISEIEDEISELNRQQVEQSENLTTRLKLSENLLKTKLREWKDAFILKAPASGKVSFFQFWSENQFVQAGEEVFSVVNSEHSKISGKVLMPILNSGKVEIGQKVNVKLLGYPYKEFGVLNGIVESISLIPRESTYLVDIEFPNGLLTSYNKRIEFRDQMEGEAEILTRDLSLIQRIFFQFKDVFINNS